MVSSAPVVYQAHPLTGEYIGSMFADPDPLVDGGWLIPAMAFNEAPPPLSPGLAAIHSKKSSETWEVVPDLRGAVYKTVDGEEVLWEQLGELPVGLTSLKRPSIYCVWREGGWYLDETAKNSEACQVERRWRDLEIGRVNWLRDRHRDEVDLKLPTTLTEIQFMQVLTYLQVLREWPQSFEFPAVEFRPKAEDWMAGLR